MKMMTEAELKVLLHRAYEEGYERGVNDTENYRDGDHHRVAFAKEERDEFIQELMSGV